MLSYKKVNKMEKNEILISIVTPTYNRKDELIELYKSLNKQTFRNFEWIIIDDGSSDNTEQIVKMMDSSIYKIKYVKKVNEGKHIALNYSHKYINGNIVGIVDSDDVLTEDAIENITSYWKLYFNNDNIAGITFQRGNFRGERFDKSLYEQKNCTYYEAVKNGLMGDHFETVRAVDFCKYIFPQFKGEKFMGELPMWLDIYQSKDIVFVDKILYLCEYLDEGLTKSGRKMRLQCPMGGKYHASVLMDKRFTLKVRFKNAMLYVCYSRILNISFNEMIKESSKNKFILVCTFLEGCILKELWCKKYLLD